MGPVLWLWCMVAGLYHCGLVWSLPDHHNNYHNNQNKRNQLLYIMMDGFRWDYVDLQPPSSLPGFNKFLREGGRARWTTPLFPSISYPTWTTLVTGRYAESHGIVGNYFYDAEDKDVFSLFDHDATGKPKWWTSEPIWTTAEKAGLRTAQFLWSRCDVPFHGVTTTFCEPFVKIPGKAIFQENIERAIEKLTGGFDFVQVYTEHTDFTGHTKGPSSPEMTQTVKDLDDVIHYLLKELHAHGLHDKVNIIIVSDHGMTSVGPEFVTYHELDNYLNTSLVEHIADQGAFMNIKVPQQNVEKVYEQVSKIPGVRAYRRADVPEKYHYRNNKYIHEIIVSADKGHYILASRSGKQLPARNDLVFQGRGAHGYRPEEPEMRGIFFAKGPDFHCGWTLEPIHVVDVYQVLTHTLNISPRPHNGTWARVQPAMAKRGVREGCEATSATPSVESAPLVLLATTLYTLSR